MEQIDAGQYHRPMVESPLISARVKPAIAAKLRAEAVRQRRSLSQLVAIVLEDFVATLPPAEKSKKKPD